MKHVPVVYLIIVNINFTLFALTVSNFSTGLYLNM